MSAGTNPKKKLFEQFARVAKSLASPNRLDLLETLAQGERSVDALAQATGMSVANTSHHLQILRDSGLAVSRKEGLQVIYRLSDDQIPTLMGCIRHIAERHLAEVGRIVREHFQARDVLTPVGRDELMARVKAGETMVIDVRPEAEYQAGHIPGAVNIPVNELPRHLETLPREQEIVAYCRGPYCMLAFEAVTQLRQAGYRARRLEDGFPEWKAENRPVDRAAPE
ncbi:MAG TPA: metalloregulator ArsR/SmtB family transcription factor [Thiobacillaceae bacterium]|nr:metalloregulator ArsR/SmtB family transcription factor [Thiobacillaceae bacterium]HNU63903.1 metalloregulator ArsR/SmtB family transcription factor [Thiobacillaceae bacterium]